MSRVILIPLPSERHYPHPFWRTWRWVSIANPHLASETMNLFCRGSHFNALAVAISRQLLFDEVIRNRFGLPFTCPSRDRWQ
jgi:predicted metalloenzyme YecM